MIPFHNIEVLVEQIQTREQLAEALFDLENDVLRLKLIERPELVGLVTPHLVLLLLDMADDSLTVSQLMTRELSLIAKLVAEQLGLDIQKLFLFHEALTNLARSIKTYDELLAWLLKLKYEEQRLSLLRRRELKELETSDFLNRLIEIKKRKQEITEDIEELNRVIWLVNEMVSQHQLWEEAMAALTLPSFKRGTYHRLLKALFLCFINMLLEVQDESMIKVLKSYPELLDQGFVEALIELLHSSNHNRWVFNFVGQVCIHLQVWRGEEYYGWLEKLLVCYKALVTYCDRDKNPESYSSLLNSLAILGLKQYERMRNDEDFSSAKKYADEFLAEQTVRNDIHGQATAYFLLGTLYLDRFNARGDYDDTEKAMNFFNKILNFDESLIGEPLCLEVYTALSQTLQVKFGKYKDKTDLNKAVEYSEMVLEKRLMSNNVSHIAHSQKNLGASLWKRHIEYGNRKDLTRSIELFEAAELVFHDGFDSRSYAEIQHMLGMALRARYRYEPNEQDISRAIDHLKKASQIYTEKREPVLYASIQHNLGLLYRDQYLLYGNETFISAAIAYHRKAITISKRLYDLDVAANYYTTLSKDYAETGHPRHQLGSLIGAIKMKEMRRLEKMEGEERNQYQSNLVNMYVEAAGLALKEKMWNTAYWLIANLKSLNLLEQIKRRSAMGKSLVRPNFDQNNPEHRQIQNDYDALIKKLDEWEEKVKRNNDAASAIEFVKLRRKVTQYIRQKVSKCDPTFAALAGNDPVRAKKVAEKLANNEAVVEFYVLPDRLVSFVLHTGIKDTGFSQADIIEYIWLDHYKLGKLRLTWLETLEKAIKEKNWTLIPEILANIYEELIESTEARLSQLKVEKIIFVPNWVIHDFPLHALPLPTGGYLGDNYQISYIPSMALWLDIAERKKTRNSYSKWEKNLFGVAVDPEFNIENETGLLFLEPELTTLSEILNNAGLNTASWQGSQCVLYGKEATPENFKLSANGSRILHISCHGVFEEVEEGVIAALALSSGQDTNEIQLLEYTEIVEKLKLETTEFVFLSACTSGRSDIKFTDEFQGLPYSFFFAGAESVLATLWPVSDICAFLLTEQFYRNWIERGDSKDKALKKAVGWLRELTVNELCNEVTGWLSNERIEKWVRKYSEVHGQYQAAKLEEWYKTRRTRYLREARKSSMDREYRLFESYKYWAPFILIGVTE
jgi:CHAT domain-containing protein